MIDEIMDVSLRFDDRSKNYLNRVLSMQSKDAMLEALRSLSGGKADLTAGTLPKQERDLCIAVSRKQRHYFKFALENGRAPNSEEINQMRHDSRIAVRMAKGFERIKHGIAPASAKDRPLARIH